MAMKNIYIVGAKRTPFGAFGGKLKNVSATDLCVESSKAALQSGNIDPSIVDTVIVGNVAQTANDAAYISRHVQLKCGIPIEKPALTINRLCGSGFQSIVNGMHEVALGEANVALCGGSENMSQAPLAVYGQNSRFGVNLGAGINLEDTLWSALTDKYAGTPMGITAENLASKYNITREQCDEYAFRSQETWLKAHESGAFEAELAPIEVKGRKGSEMFSVDETPRLTALEKMAKLKPVFKKDGTVTAANASGISDGAGSVVIASEDAVKQHGLKPMSRIVSYAVSGVDPTIMGIGPVPAIRTALEKAGLTLGDMDLVEINEAFAPQYLACEKELGLDRSITNTMGGAISLGHPLGASGSRIMTHLAHQLNITGKKYAVGSACIGGGQGIAIIIENMA